MTQFWPTDEAHVEALIERRRKVRLWWGMDLDGDDIAWKPADGSAPIGLALSGGGIRSATFSLGLLQALAKSKRDALAKIDVLSTVSGGGYVGCFLRSLFVPNALRGIEGGAAGASVAAKADQYRLARRALAGDASVREIAWPPDVPGPRRKMRNPIWWLREHSRYLAPSGPTDFGFAIAYIARNWIAMVYVVVLACTALGTALVSAEAAMLAVLGAAGLGAAGPVPLSPVYVVAIVPVVASAALSVAYWATQAMSTNEANVAKQRRSLGRATGWITLSCAAAIALVLAVVRFAPRAVGTTDPTWSLGHMFLGVIASGIFACLVGVAISLLLGSRLQNRGALLTTEMRRLLTGALATSNRWLVIVLAIATIDSLGAALDLFLRSARTGTGGVPLALLPVFAFLIKKLPDWFGSGSKDGSGIGGLLQRFATAVAMVAGVLLYASLAIAALALVHHAMWTGAAWTGVPRWWRMGLLAGIVWVLAVVLGKSTGFINLSSLHSLYAARLTRAYLGASNVERLERAVAGAHREAPITENHERDYIQPRVYGETDLPAPIHVVNVTLNQTIDPGSQIVARDRKGDIMSLEPGGVRVGRGLVGWDSLKTRSRAENISLGQWVAISGAAASAGMGRMSSLGFALAFTFANVRLGYWWWSPNLCPDMPAVKGPRGWVARHFGTFVYLMNEMTCRYSRGYYRKYLTDGGHYENSGAFVLIRRRVPLILVTDNGADPGYAFADLESLVRQVRIDLGGETTILGGGDLASQLAQLGATDASIFVDPQAHRDWRARMTDAGARAHVLVLRVTIGTDTLHLLWLKPRLLPDVPIDVAGYAVAMPSFPQQPTGDQFFDEAQWESYRRLGEFSMMQLLDACPKLLA